MLTELEEILYKFNSKVMIAKLKANPELFDEAIKMALTDRQPLAWRAAWLLSGCMEENDIRIKKYIRQLIKALDGKKDGHQRELMRVLLKMQIGSRDEGYLFDRSLKLWEAIDKTPSVRIMGLKFMIKMAEKYPELAEEFEYMLSDRYLDTFSPGARKSVLKTITKVFNKSKKIRL